MQRVDVIGFQGLLTRFHQHAAFHPHFHTLGHLKVCAFGNKGRCEPGVASSESLIVEGLREAEVSVGIGAGKGPGSGGHWG